MRYTIEVLANLPRAEELERDQTAGCMRLVSAFCGVNTVGMVNAEARELTVRGQFEAGHEKATEERTVEGWGALMQGVADSVWDRYRADPPFMGVRSVRVSIVVHSKIGPISLAVTQTATGRGFPLIAEEDELA